MIRALGPGAVSQTIIRGSRMKAKPTVLGLMGVVACFAVGLAAVRSNDEYTAAAVFAFTYLILCTSTLLAIYRRGAWAGFAVFGWAQFLICQPHTAPSLGPTSLSQGITYRILTVIHGTAAPRDRASQPSQADPLIHDRHGPDGRREARLGGPVQRVCEHSRLHPHSRSSCQSLPVQPPCRPFGSHHRGCHRLSLSPGIGQLVWQG